MLHSWESDYSELLTHYGEGFQAGNHINDCLNMPVSRDEVQKILLKLKNGKSVGVDNLANEILKHKKMLSVLYTLYAKCFDSGLIPEMWKISIINPISKKGKDPRIPSNNRAISLMSTVAKGYTQLLNSRITQYLEENGILADEQNGFRKMRSTIDHLYTMINILKERKRRNKSTYVCYVDFARAFDCVPHDLLRLKLLQNGIDGKIYKSICSLYLGMKSFIRLNGYTTDYFPVSIGTRQGDNLSPTLFNLYINELINDIKQLDLGVPYGNSKVDILAYADDLVLMAENEEDLQSMITCLHTYCRKWRLSVNTNKTQIMHFRKRGQPETDYQFKYANQTISKTDTYRYLGFNLNSNLDMGASVDVLINASSRALASISSKYYQLNGLDHDSFKVMFDMLVQPVMNYASAVWGSAKFEKCQTIQNRAMRTFLGVGKTAPISAIMGDLAWSPVNVSQRKEVITYWLKLCKLPDSRLLKQIFNHDQAMATRGRVSPGYEVKLLLENADLRIWEDQNSQQMIQTEVEKAVHKSMMAETQEEINTDIHTMSRLEVYKHLKHDFNPES